MSIATELEHGVRVLVAPNPSPMTYKGTNTYLIGQESLAVIDPGPNIPSHMDAILAAADGARIEAIFVTHSHLDHSPLAHPLSDVTGAPVYAFGPHDAGRAPHMNDLAATGHVGGGEGIDAVFRPDHRLEDGAVLRGVDWQVTAIWTPGHLSNHMCFAVGDALFTGDHVMGWASSIVSPPDGDLTAFMASCQKLHARRDRVFYPGHGDLVREPTARLEWLIAHRESRTAQILSALDTAPDRTAGLTRRIYHDVGEALLPAAERNVLAHLIDLVQRGLVDHEDPISSETLFRRH